MFFGISVGKKSRKIYFEITHYQQQDSADALEDIIDKTEFVVALVGKQTRKVIRRVDDEYQGRDCERLL